MWVVKVKEFSEFVHTVLDGLQCEALGVGLSASDLFEEVSSPNEKTAFHSSLVSLSPSLSNPLLHHRYSLRPAAPKVYCSLCLDWRSPLMSDCPARPTSLLPQCVLATFGGPVDCSAAPSTRTFLNNIHIRCHKHPQAVYYSFLSAGLLSATLHTGFLLHMLACYRKHIRRLCKGDASFLPKLEKYSPVFAIVDGLKYAGFQVKAATMVSHVPRVASLQCAARMSGVAACADPLAPLFNFLSSQLRLRTCSLGGRLWRSCCAWCSWGSPSPLSCPCWTFTATGSGGPGFSGLLCHWPLV